jgi:hypothetical protein
MFRSSVDHYQGAFWSWLKSLVKIWVFLCVELGYAAAYLHSFYMLSCVERHVELNCTVKQWNSISVNKSRTSMEHSPSWEADSFSEEVPYILWNPNVHDHAYKSPPHVPNLSQINPVRFHLSVCFNIRFNIIPSMPKCYQWSLSLKILVTNGTL